MRKLVLSFMSSTFIFATTTATISCYFNPSDKMTDAEKIASIKNMSQKDLSIADFDFPTYFSAELQRQIDDNFSEFFSDNKIDEKTQLAMSTNGSTGIIANEAFVQLGKKNKKFSWMFQKTRQQGERFGFNNFSVDNLYSSFGKMFVDEKDWVVNVTFLNEELKPWLLTSEIFVLEDEDKLDKFSNSKNEHQLVDILDPLEEPEVPEEPEDLVYYNVDLSKLESYPKYLRFNILGKVIYDNNNEVIVEESNSEALVYNEKGVLLKKGETFFKEGYGPVFQGMITSSIALRLEDYSFEDENYYEISPMSLDYTISVFDFWNNVSDFNESL
ncbi:hypothetical protein [Spiroplasma endosymbiont of Panorpa germanica]|uniref:hypothetical protein n=1 Tax=Spiroplasma endosymbiont of Panorpa germanica TaxID=3066314 RepID=UPI0030D0AC7B